MVGNILRGCLFEILDVKIKHKRKLIWHSNRISDKTQFIKNKLSYYLSSAAIERKFNENATE